MALSQCFPKARRAGLTGLSVLAVAGMMTSIFASPTVAQSVEKRVVGYYPNYNIYGRKHYVKNIIDTGQADHLTHLFYAFGTPTADGECTVTDPNADYNTNIGANPANSIDGASDPSYYGGALRGNWRQLALLKERHPNIKILMSLGGFGHSTHFRAAALTDESRKKFVKSCMDRFIKGIGLPALDNKPVLAGVEGVFDGFDLDWEWPATALAAGNPAGPEDKANYVALFEEFRRQLDAYGEETGRTMELASFLPANPGVIDRGIDVRGVFNVIDFGAVQGYDLHGAFPGDKLTNHGSALHIADGDPSGLKVSLESVVDDYICSGAPPEKIVVGVPGYGRGWAQVEAGDSNGLGQPSGPLNDENPNPVAAPGTFGPGVDDYKVLAARFAGNIQRQPEAGASFGYDADKKEFWTFETPQDIRNKMRWQNLRGLGGAMIYELSSGDGELVAAMGNGIQESLQTFCGASNFTIEQEIQPQRCKQAAVAGEEGAARNRKVLDQLNSVAHIRACRRS